MVQVKLAVMHQLPLAHMTHRHRSTDVYARLSSSSISRSRDCFLEFRGRLDSSSRRQPTGGSNGRKLTAKEILREEKPSSQPSHQLLASWRRHRQKICRSRNPLQRRGGGSG